MMMVMMVVIYLYQYMHHMLCSLWSKTLCCIVKEEKTIPLAAFGSMVNARTCHVMVHLVDAALVV